MSEGDSDKGKGVQKMGENYGRRLSMAPFLTEVTAVPEERREGGGWVPCVVYLLAGSRLIRLVTHPPSSASQQRHRRGSRHCSDKRLSE